MKKDLLKSNKGISMIALIITILVMLILAIVVITLTSGEDGVMSNAERAKRAQTIALIDEVADLYSNTKLLEDEKLMIINNEIEESGEDVKQNLLDQMKKLYGVNANEVFLGRVNMLQVEEEVKMLLKDKIEKEGVVVTGIFNGIRPESLWEGEDPLITITDEIREKYNNFEENKDKYEFLYDITIDFFNETGEGAKYPDLTAGLSRMVAYIFKLAVLDHYVVKIEYDTEVWYLTSNGEKIIEYNDSDEFKYSDDNESVIGYYGSEKEVTIPRSSPYSLETIKEIGMKNGSYRNESTDEFCYHESYWSLFEDKEMKMSGLIASEGDMLINESTIETWAAMLTASPDDGGLGITLNTNRDNYEDDESYRKALYLEILNLVKGTEYDSDGDGINDDVYFYMDPTTGQFVESTQTVESIIVPEDSDIEKIWNYAFAGDSKLKSVEIPASLFGEYTAADVPADIIGYNAFEGSHPDLVIHIKTPAGWTSEDCATAESRIYGLNDAKNDEEEGYTISWE